MSLPKNILQKIVEYLPLKDILSLSQTNKVYYKFLTTENKYVNFLWKQQCTKKFIENFDESENSVKNAKNTEGNWKLLYIERVLQHKKLPKKLYDSIPEQILDIIKNPIYLPELRKTDQLLENGFNSFHQIKFLGIKESEREKENKIEKNLIREYKAKKGKLLYDCTEKINELIDPFYENETNLMLIKKILNYDYNIELFDFRNTNINFQKFFYFLKWIIDELQAQCKLNYYLILEKKADPIQFIYEYVERHAGFIEISLLLEEKLANISSVLNYISGQNKKNKTFSLYKFFMNIWYNIVFIPFRREINEKVRKIMPLFLKEVFEEKEDSMEVEDEEEVSVKRLVENTANCLLDFSVDEVSVEYLNHNSMPVSREYEDFENILLSETFFYIHEQVEKDIPSKRNIYEKLENFSPFDFSFINRTKVKLNKIFILAIKDSVKEDLKENFEEYILSSKKKDFPIGLDSVETSNDNIRKCVENEIKNISIYLDDIGFQKGFDTKQCEKLANSFINSSNKQIRFLKNILQYYYEDLENLEMVSKKINKHVRPKNKVNSSKGSIPKCEKLFVKINNKMNEGILEKLML